jgi:hypothetical protein
MGRDGHEGLKRLVGPEGTGRPGGGGRVVGVWAVGVWAGRPR